MERMGKRILVILGHPATQSFCGAVADSYAEGARAAQHEVQVITLSALAFDPVLHQGYATVQKLEPDRLRYTLPDSPSFGRKFSG